MRRRIEDRAANARKDSGLLGVEREIGRLQKGVLLIRVAPDGFLAGDEHSVFHERLDRLVRDAAFLDQLRHGDWFTGVFQKLDHARLLRRAAFKLGDAFFAQCVRQMREELRLVRDLGPADDLRQDAAHRRLDGTAVVVRDPVSEPDQQRIHEWPLADDGLNRTDASRIAVVENFDDRRERHALAHGHLHAGAGLDFRLQCFGNFVVEDAAAGLVHDDSSVFRHDSTNLSAAAFFVEFFVREANVRPTMRLALKILLPLFGIAAAILAAFVYHSSNARYIIHEMIQPSRFHQLDPLIVDAANRNGIDPMLLKAIIWRESRFRPERSDVTASAD